MLWSTRVTIELKANLIRPESKHHDEPIQLPFKSVRSCVICGKPTNWHCWGCTEDIGGIFEREAMQCGASPNSSGDLAQFVCRTSFQKMLWTQGIVSDEKLLKFFTQIQISIHLLFTVKKLIYTAFMRAARATRLFKSKNYMHVELVYKPIFANKYKSFLSQPSFFFASNLRFLL